MKISQQRCALFNFHRLSTETRIAPVVLRSFFSYPPPPFCPAYFPPLACIPFFPNRMRKGRLRAFGFGDAFLRTTMFPGAGRVVLISGRTRFLNLSSRRFHFNFIFSFKLFASRNPEAFLSGNFDGGSPMPPFLASRVK